MINSINLLFITRHPDLADQVIGRIRQRGNAVRPKQAGNVRDLNRLLQSHRFDALVLMDADLEIGLDDLNESLHRSGRQTPAVVITTRGDPQRLQDLDNGAFAVVDSQYPDLAAAMILKAVEHLGKNRELNHLRTLLREADRRYLLMLDTSRNPIACFYQGVATYANDTWRDCFELDLTESLDRVILQELVVPEQQEDLLRLLSIRQSQPENMETCETLTLRTQRGRTFDADLLLAGAIIDGNPCTVVHLSLEDNGLLLDAPSRTTARLGVDPAAPRTAPRPSASPPSGTQPSAPQPSASAQAAPYRSDPAPARPAPPPPAAPAPASPPPPAAPPPEPAPRARPQFLNAHDFLEAVKDRLLESARSERPFGLLVLALDAADPSDVRLADRVHDEIGLLLRGHFPAPAAVALLEGGHYGVVLADIARETLEQQLNALLADTHGRSIDLGQSSISGSLSCGAMLADDSGPMAEDLIKLAQQAMAEARAAGGNRFGFPALPGARHGNAEADALWKSRIEDAIRNDRLRLLYQPVVSLHGADIPCYTVYVRLEGADGEAYEPTDFLPAAEREGVAAPLDRWIIQHALVVLAKECQRDPRTVFFVKLSQGSLGAEPVAAWLQPVLERHHVPPANLVVEFKEASILTELDHAIQTAQGLKDLGVGLCIADFGNGLDPFQLFEHIDAGYIRLDGAYVETLARDASTQTAVQEFTHTAHASQRQVIVPFVEDASTLTVLFGMEVNLVQGYFVHPPSEQPDYNFAEGL